MFATQGTKQGQKKTCCQLTGSLQIISDIVSVLSKIALMWLENTLFWTCICDLAFYCDILSGAYGLNIHKTKCIWWAWAWSPLTPVGKSQASKNGEWINISILTLAKWENRSAICQGRYLETSEKIDDSMETTSQQCCHVATDFISVSVCTLTKTHIMNTDGRSGFERVFLSAVVTNT